MESPESARVPVCAYRVQLHGKFAFADLTARLPYFRDLGISDFYLSPIFTATPGSQHGYDVTDFRSVNPELGGTDGFDRLGRHLRAHGIGLMLDFVPNHMGIAGARNLWWRDVLEYGPLSPYASFFDIQWNCEEGHERPRVLVPLLEDHYGIILERGKIKLSYTDEFLLRYGEIAMPVNPGTYARILERFAPRAGPASDQRAVAELGIAFAALPKSAAVPDRAAAQERTQAADQLKQELAARITQQPELRDRLETLVAEVNGEPGRPASFNELHEVIERQHYRLARWKTGTHEINYRRFFAIDTLVGLNMDRPEVFRECHALLSRLIAEGPVTGIRIDHIDGLRLPEEYLHRLQALATPRGVPQARLWVEKILARGETLPDSWPVEGTTGYEFILQLADLLVDPAAEGRFSEIYREFTGEKSSYAEVVHAKKRLIIEEMFANAVSNLGAELAEIVRKDRRWRDLTRHELTNAVGELVANLPVYRTYRKNEQPATAPDRRVLEEACAEALRRNPRADPQPLEFVRDVLIGRYPENEMPGTTRARLVSWVLTVQQYTGAVMAKSAEDTAFYTYCRFIALNEVGGDPATFGGSAEGFHRTATARSGRSPRGLLSTSTHDTKLSEDVRARLYGLSEMADEWESWIRDWHQRTSRHTTRLQDQDAPDAIDEYRFYQILLGAWPLEANEADDALRARLREHFRKAVNEAKRHTSVLQANEAYLQACDQFVDRITRQETARDFLAAFLPAARCIARRGMINSLTQVILKCTVPGIPEFYQGNEIWDFSLVDPDNRRAVDFDRRADLLALVAGSPLPGLLENWRDGGIKLRLTQGLLRFRSEHTRLFGEGDYQPVAAEGEFANHLIAFTRNLGSAAALVVVPRLTARLGSPPLGLVWDDTRLARGSAGGSWRDYFTGRIFRPEEPLWLRGLFAELPFAVLQRIAPPPL